MRLQPADRLTRRRSFDEVADVYAAARPGYPEAAFDAIAERVPPPARVLEVGPGPGTATAPLAVRGYEVVAVELGKTMAATARLRLRRFPNVRVVHADFEAWSSDEPFDLLLAASSWHWIDPAGSYAAAHRELRPGGWLALLANHPRPGRRGSRIRAFWDLTDEMYRRHAPVILERGMWSPHRMPYTAATLRRSGLFEAVQRITWRWRRDFAVDEYLALLETYSDHRTLPAAQRGALVTAIRRVIETQFGGVVRREYWTHLHLGRAR